jgi:hypothetical protein
MLWKAILSSRTFCPKLETSCGFASNGVYRVERSKLNSSSVLFPVSLLQTMLISIQNDQLLSLEREHINASIMELIYLDLLNYSLNRHRHFSFLTQYVAPRWEKYIASEYLLSWNVGQLVYRCKE